MLYVWIFENCKCTGHDNKTNLLMYLLIHGTFFLVWLNLQNMFKCILLVYKKDSKQESTFMSYLNMISPCTQFYITGVDGGWALGNSVEVVWSSWSPWEGCSVTCGGGIRGRTRTCNATWPNYGGKRCVGDTYNTTTCSTPPCPGTQWYMHICISYGYIYLLL